MPSAAELYRVLELTPGASPDEVRAAWRDLVQVWHPDRFQGNERLRARAEARLKQINEAYEKIRELEAAGAAAGAASRASAAPGRRYEPQFYAARPQDPNLLEVLAEGVNAWNLWRKKYMDVIPNLARMRLARRHLPNADFRECEMAGVDLSGADLYKANLSYAKVRNGRLGGADLNRAVLLETDLRFCDLAGADLSGADLRGADLSGARLGGANLVAARLEGANLTGAAGLTRRQLEYAYRDGETRLPAAL